MNQKIEKLLPSKKFIKVFGGITLGILAILLIGGIANKNTIYKQNSNSKGQVVVVNDAISEDTDQDGLKDWEESLWGTDPNNPDTDGNGVSDGEQFKKIQGALSGITEEQANDLTTDKTKTGALTRDILTIAKAINQTGATEESRNAITDEVAKYLEKREQTIFSPADLTIVEKPTANQTRNYVNIMKKSVEGTTLTQNDVQLISEYEQNMDTNNMAPYLETGQKFKKERDFIKKVTVPEQYISIHLQYLSSLDGLGNLYYDIGQQEEDPAKALSAFLGAQSIFEQYQNILELMQK